MKTPFGALEIDRLGAALRSWKVKLSIAVPLCLLAGLGLLMGFDHVPREVRVFSTSNGNSQAYPARECQADWFPARHWARPSAKYAAQRPDANGRQMYGTLAAQHVIWNHQHPRTCHDKAFLVYEALGRDHGIGSTLHVLGVALQVALNLNRILVLSPQPDVEWVQGKFCNGTETLDECYFEPLSSCTVYDAMRSREDGQLADIASMPELSAKTYSSNSDRVLRTAVYRLGVMMLPFLMHDTPLTFRALLKRGGVDPSFFYWWRAQSTAYIVRPSLRTLRELDRRREALFKGQRIQPGTISVHVRHGDKWKEAKLEPDETFLRTAETLLAVVNAKGQAKAKAKSLGYGSVHVPAQAPLQRRIFLSTEDPSTVRFFAALQNWTVQYTEVMRDGSDPNVGPEDFAARIGWDEEFLNSMLSLDLALECDGFVGAISSNWNRLIDELRSTIRCKHHRVYVDVVQGFNVTDYVW